MLKRGSWVVMGMGMGMGTAPMVWVVMGAVTGVASHGCCCCMFSMSWITQATISRFTRMRAIQRSVVWRTLRMVRNSERARSTRPCCLALALWRRVLSAIWFFPLSGPSWDGMTVRILLTEEVN